MIEISFTIPGPVVPWARTGGNGRARFTPERNRNYTALVKQTAVEVLGDRPLLQGPVRVDITIRMMIPPSWPKWRREAATDGRFLPTGRPDVDNAAKGITDAMNGLVYADDAQIQDLRVRKEYGLEGYAVGVDVRVRELPQAVRK